MPPLGLATVLCTERHPVTPDLRCTYAEGSLVGGFLSLSSVDGGSLGVGPSPGFTSVQGLTHVHFSAQLEPCLTHKTPLHTENTPQTPLNTGYRTPTRTPYPIKSAQVELKCGRV